MKKSIIYTAIVTLLMTGCSQEKKASFIETIPSQNSVEKTTQKLIDEIKKEGLVYYETFDHSAKAKGVNLRLPAKRVIMFGNPNFATTLMKCNASMGLDLPLRILVSSTYEGEVTMSYTNPEYWSLKHNIKDQTCLRILNKASFALENLVDEASKK
jgi:uncharacterized protein (DUF302 family)